MILGLGKAQTKKPAKTSSKGKSTAQADEAAAILKKMEDKKASGDCPFC